MLRWPPETCLRFLDLERPRLRAQKEHPVVFLPLLRLSIGVFGEGVTSFAAEAHDKSMKVVAARLDGAVVGVGLMRREMFRGRGRGRVLNQGHKPWPACVCVCVCDVPGTSKPLIRGGLLGCVTGRGYPGRQGGRLTLGTEYKHPL